VLAEVVEPYCHLIPQCRTGALRALSRDAHERVIGSMIESIGCCRERIHATLQKAESPRLRDVEAVTVHVRQPRLCKALRGAKTRPHNVGSSKQNLSVLSINRGFLIFYYITTVYFGNSGSRKSKLRLATIVFFVPYYISLRPSHAVSTSKLRPQKVVALLLHTQNKYKAFYLVTELPDINIRLCAFASLLSTYRVLSI
jgi:hypothetical protein